jgi:uncharacterized RDD family membrane protein YckC
MEAPPSQPSEPPPAQPGEAAGAERAESRVGQSNLWGERAGAALVDLTIAIVLIAVAVGLGAVIVSAGDWAVGVGALVMLAGPVAALLYAPAMMARQGEGNGLTIGKRMVGVRVVRDDGRPIGFWLALGRLLVVLVGTAITGGPFLLVDALWPLFDKRDRAIHDIVVETHVVPA